MSGPPGVASVTPASDSISRSVWRWQLVLAGCAVTIALTTTFLAPEQFARWPTVTGFSAVILLTIAVLCVPWDRLPRGTVVIVPMLDILVLGLLAMNDDLRSSLLWVVPLAWIASYYAYSWIIAGLAVIAVLVALFATVGGATASSVLRTITTVLALTFISITIHVGSRRTQAFSRLLRRRSAQLERTVARVETRERLNLEILDSLEVAVAHIDLDRGILFANAAFRRLYGLNELSAGHPSRAIEYDSRQGAALPVDSQLVARAARGERLEQHRVWLFGEDAAWHALDATTQPLGNGTTVLQVREVTGTVDAEREREMMAGVISHELRNPLTAIMGHAELLLERDDLTPVVRDRLAVIDNAGQRMERLIGTALTPSTHDSRDVSPFDLRRIVEESLAAYQPAAGQAALTLSAQVGEELPLTGDAFRLRQVTDNVIGNAIKYTPQGGTVHVSTAMTFDTVEVTVSDTGVGIAASDLTHVFEPRFRTQRVRDSGIPGTGLGLSIARDIVLDHGGVIDVTSTLGSGTHVTIALPRHCPEGDAA